MVRLFRVKNQLPNNWYNLTDEEIREATTPQELIRLKGFLLEQARAFWITEREKYASLYLMSKATHRAKYMSSQTKRISIKSFNQ